MHFLHRKLRICFQKLFFYSKKKGFSFTNFKKESNLNGKMFFKGFLKCFLECRLKNIPLVDDVPYTNGYYSNVIFLFATIELIRLFWIALTRSIDCNWLQKHVLLFFVFSIVNKEIICRRTQFSWRRRHMPGQSIIWYFLKVCNRRHETIKESKQVWSCTFTFNWLRRKKTVKKGFNQLKITVNSTEQLPFSSRM